MSHIPLTFGSLVRHPYRLKKKKSVYTFLSPGSALPRLEDSPCFFRSFVPNVGETKSEGLVDHPTFWTRLLARSWCPFTGTLSCFLKAGAHIDRLDGIRVPFSAAKEWRVQRASCHLIQGPRGAARASSSVRTVGGSGGAPVVPPRHKSSSILHLVLPAYTIRGFSFPENLS